MITEYSLEVYSKVSLSCVHNKGINILFITGENIYQVTQNGHILEHQQHPSGDQQQNKPALNEMELFAKELLGDRINNDPAEINRNFLKLSIKDMNANTEPRKVTFDPIEVKVDNSNHLESFPYIGFDEEQNAVANQFLDLIKENENE